METSSYQRRRCIPSFPLSANPVAPTAFCRQTSSSSEQISMCRSTTNALRWFALVLTMVPVGRKLRSLGPRLLSGGELRLQIRPLHETDPSYARSHREHWQNPWRSSRRCQTEYSVFGYSETDLVVCYYKKFTRVQNKWQFSR